MNITIDIETIPDQSQGARESFLDDARTNFKAPSTLTKEQAAKDLGMTDANEIKSTSKDAMIARWEERFASERCEEVGDAAWRKTSFDGGRGQIACVSVAIDDAAPACFWSDDWATAEPKILCRMFDNITTNRGHGDRPCFVGHNVGFDLRFVWQRAVILGIRPPLWWPANPKPWDSDVAFDTMTQWAGAGNRISLDNLCLALGVPGKDGFDGSMVWDAVRAGRIAEVAEYCNGDVKRARACYRMMVFA